LHSLISEGKELDDVNVRYLKDCSDKFNSKQKTKKAKQPDGIKGREADPSVKKTLPKKTGTAKDAVIGFVVIAVIIIVVVGVVMAVFPGETETKQNEQVKTQPTNTQNKIINEQTSVEFDPNIVAAAKESIPVFQDAFRTVLDQCNAVNSRYDYVVFASAITIAQEQIMESTEQMNAALSVLELMGYDKHASIGPMIKETRQLAGAAGDCITFVQNKYGN
jgi:hypothetical protein